MQDGAVAGFKYFDFIQAEYRIVLELRGDAKGAIQVSVDPQFGTLAARIPVEGSGRGICRYTGRLSLPETKRQPLYFRYVGEGAVDFIGFALHPDSC